MINIRQLFKISTLFVALVAKSQEFPKEVSPATLEISGQKMEGFETDFDFSEKEIYFGWWKYAKQFSRPRNQRTHYESTIPETRDAKEILLFAKVQTTEEPYLAFQLGLKSTGMSEDQKKQYMDQLKAIIWDFKRWFYRKHWQAKLEDCEKSHPEQNQNWSEWIRFAREREAIIASMKKIQ
jgi:hypothetical protein